MAQFQILYPYSATEWRSITIEFCLAPCGDQQYLWPSFEEAETARRHMHERSPNVQLRITLAGSDADDIDWQMRETLRFANGAYATTPWHDEPWYQARHGEHFCHVSTEQAGKIAFTENAAKGQADRQLVMSPGRYLHRFFSDQVDNTAIESWCARLSVQLEEDALKITQNADEIEEVYVGGPCSCMAHHADDFESSCHPVRVYAGPDTALAYIGPREDARGRSIIWPERKIYTSLYGDVSRLRLLLENAGYTEGSLDGARIRRIEEDRGFVVPYIDKGGNLADDGGYLVIGEGDIHSGSTDGLSCNPWYCPRCDCEGEPHQEVHFPSGFTEEWCYGCYENRTTYCEHNHRHYSDTETFVTVYNDHGDQTVLEEDVEEFGAVYIEDRSEWWVSSRCRQCDGAGEWFLDEDLTEYHGEWLCEDHLPAPLDDDDVSHANAHILSRQQFLDDMAAIHTEVAKWQAAGNRARQRRLQRGLDQADRLQRQGADHQQPTQPGCPPGGCHDHPGTLDHLLTAFSMTAAASATVSSPQAGA